jgi:two-component system, NarL family, invasion response regulator UvrY
VIRVLIADDFPATRIGLCGILKGASADVVCGEAKNADQVLAQVRSHKWDLVILDITMPGRSGIDVLADLKREQPKLPVLILSMHPEDQYAKRVLKAGASGYMNKEAAPEELMTAVRKVLAGGTYVSAALAEKMAFDLSAGGEQPLHEQLSNRELEVLRMIGMGRSTSEIATELHLSATTVSTYRSRILEKMNMTTTAELMHYAMASHLVDS